MWNCFTWRWAARTIDLHLEIDLVEWTKIKAIWVDLIQVYHWLALLKWVFEVLSLREISVYQISLFNVDFQVDMDGFFFLFYVFIWERERSGERVGEGESMSRGEGEEGAEGGRDKQTPCWTGGTGGGRGRVRVPSQDPGIMTWAKGRSFTNWAIQAPLR